jgi:hypothetical protein
MFLQNALSGDALDLYSGNTRLKCWQDYIVAGFLSIYREMRAYFQVDYAHLFTIKDRFST